MYQRWGLSALKLNVGSQCDHDCPLLLFLSPMDGPEKVLWGPVLDAVARTGNKVHVKIFNLLKRDSRRCSAGVQYTVGRHTVKRHNSNNSDDSTLLMLITRKFKIRGIYGGEKNHATRRNTLSIEVIEIFRCIYFFVKHYWDYLSFVLIDFGVRGERESEPREKIYLLRDTKRYIEIVYADFFF